MDVLVYGLSLGGLALASFAVTFYGLKGGLGDDSNDCNTPNGVNCDPIWTSRATVFVTVALGLPRPHVQRPQPSRKSVQNAVAEQPLARWHPRFRWWLHSLRFSTFQPSKRSFSFTRGLLGNGPSSRSAVALFTIISECYKIVKNALFPMTMHTDRTPIEIEIEPPPAPHVPLPQIASEDVQESFVRMETRLGTPTVEHEDYRSHHKPFSYHVNEEDEKTFELISL